jgi:signal transduction histidine kinase
MGPPLFFHTHPIAPHEGGEAGADVADGVAAFLHEQGRQVLADDFADDAEGIGAEGEEALRVVAMETSVAPDLPPALADPALLEQVLFNLLDNAHKYGGSAPVSVFARADGGRLAISVTDQGKGISAAELDKVFENFYRRARGDGRPAGTGLGLAIARGLVSSMGGTIEAISPAVRRRG